MSEDLFTRRIDSSTDGPVPAKDDLRPVDILSAQRQRQTEEAIGGIDQIPLPKSPEIPEPPQVSPPPLPSIDFGAAFTPPIIRPEEQTREIARQEFFDLLKNVTINGQSPSMDGSFVSFNVPVQPSANEIFAAQNISTPQISSSPAAITIDFEAPRQPSQPAIIAAPEITSFDISLPQPNLLDVGGGGIAPENKIDFSGMASSLDPDVLKTQDAYQNYENIRARIDETSFNEAPKMSNQADVSSRLVDNEENLIETRSSLIDAPPSPTTSPPYLPEPNPEPPPDRNPPASTPIDKPPKRDEETDKPKEDDYKRPELDKANNYASAHEPFPPLQRFTVCQNGEAKEFLIPAFEGGAV